VLRKRLLIITPSLKTPSYYYRIAQYVPHLEESGFETRTVEIPKIMRSDIRRLRDDLEQSSAIFLQKKLLKHSEAVLLDPWKGRIIFDFDDAIFLPAFNEARGLSGLYERWRRRGKFLRTLRTSALVICASDYLAATCHRLGFKATVLPMAVPLERYHRGHIQRDDETFTIGWIGMKANLRYLNLIRPVLKRLNEQFPIVLKVIARDRPDISECPIAFKPWRLEDEADDLASLDVGIAPLTDDPWTRGKAPVKVLQYMATGLPAVCSDLGTNRDVIQSGENGFLAKNTNEWVEILERLARDRDLRRRVGEKARATVARKYSLEVIAPRIVDAIRHFTQNSKDYDSPKPSIME
jgi:glycosyltransferase involved in cell wall biosynthesis